MKKVLFIIVTVVCFSCSSKETYEGRWECIQGNSTRFIEITHLNGDNYTFKDNDNTYYGILKNDIMTVTTNGNILSFPLDKNTGELLCEYGCNCTKFIKKQN